MIIEPEKQRWRFADAIPVAAEICARLKPATERLVVAGSMRRGKPTVGDIEVLYIPRLVERMDPGDLLGATELVNLADEAIGAMEREGILTRRQNVKGSEMFGEKNKLMRHDASGIPVDLFAATEENWWNYLVCRTGPADSNTRIATRAQQMGWKWNPYGAGFTRGGALAGQREQFVVTCEEEVFQFVGLPYLKPEERR